jgi:hypothetical protein
MVPSFLTSVLDGGGWSVGFTSLLLYSQETAHGSRWTGCCEQENISYFTGNQAPVAGPQPVATLRIPGLVSAYACKSRLDF